MSRIIPAEQLQSYVRRDTPVVIGVTRSADSGGAGTQDRIAEREKQAYQDGLRRGQKDGFHAGMREAAATMAPIIAALNRPLAELDAQLETQLVEMTLAIARQIIRRELKLDPGQIIAVIRESLAVLPAASPRVRIMLHPEDIALVRESMPGIETGEGVQLIEDPSLTRGGCRVVTDISQIDATVESRIAAIATQLLGGERGTDGAA